MREHPVWDPNRRSLLISNPVHNALSLCLESLLATVCFSLSLASLAANVRSSLWAAGAAQGWNSDPHARLYFYANYETPPPVPFIWSKDAAVSSASIAAVGVAICVVRWLALLFGFQLGAVHALYDLILTALWHFGLEGQSSGDESDPEHQSAKPWYLEKRCGAVSQPARNDCALMQALWCFSVVALLLYSSRCILWVLNVVYRAGWIHGRGGSARAVVDRLLLADDFSGTATVSDVSAKSTTSSIHV